jgi:hypothetical protein
MDHSECQYHVSEEIHLAEQPRDLKISPEEVVDSN